MPRRDSIPVERSSVSASVRARRCDCSPSMSTSSYSSRPSWATVRPPADTKRRDGKVGSPNSSAPALGVEPSVHDGEGAFGLGAFGRDRAAGRCTRRRWSEAGVHEAGRHPHDALVGPQLDVGGHLDGHLAGARPASIAVDVVGPRVASRHGDDGAHRSPLGDRQRHAVGGVHDAVAGRGRVVVGVAVVPAVHQPAEPGHAVEGEGPVVAVDGHGHEPVRR